MVFGQAPAAGRAEFILELLNQLLRSVGFTGETQGHDAAGDRTAEAAGVADAAAEALGGL